MGGESIVHQTVRTFSGLLMIGSLLTITYAFAVPWYGVDLGENSLVFSLETYTSETSVGWWRTYVSDYDFFPWNSVRDLMVIMEAVLMVLLVLAIVSLLGLLKDDSASGIIGASIFVLLGTAAVVYFALTIAVRIPAETLMWDTNVTSFIGNDGAGASWGPKIGWYLVILAMVLRAASEVVRAILLPLVDRSNPPAITGP